MLIKPPFLHISWLSLNSMSSPFSCFSFWLDKILSICLFAQIYTRNIQAEILDLRRAQDPRSSATQLHCLMYGRPFGYRPSGNNAPYKISQIRSRPYMHIKRLPSMGREANLRQDRKGIKGVGVLMFSFRLLNWPAEWAYRWLWECARWSAPAGVRLRDRSGDPSYPSVPSCCHLIVKV